MSLPVLRSAGAALLAVLAAGCSADAAPEPQPDVKTPGAMFATPQSDGEFSIAQMLAEVPVNDTESAFFVKTFHNRATSVDDAHRICRDGPLAIREDATFVAATVLEASHVVWFVTLSDADLDPIR